MTHRDAIFEERRGAMTGLAYRMLGSRADAEDVVQDAWLRWRGVETDAVTNPAGFLNRVVTRLCLDRLKSARARREVYVGEWLPEPVVDEDHQDLGENLSVAFLLAWDEPRRPAASWPPGPASTSRPASRVTTPAPRRNSA
jgi:RNA polymerase sigma-70 factor (ECF subfamily)